MSSRGFEAMCFLIFSGLAMLSGAAGQTQVNFIPVLYVAPEPERPPPDAAILYSATVCDGKLYHGNLTVVRVNLPYGWNPDIGAFAKLEVCDTTACSKLYCSNYASGKFTGNHFCNYTYNATIMGDIAIRVTAGPSPNIDWTVAVEFITTKKWVPPAPVAPRRALAHFPEPKAKNGVRAAVTVLMQIVKTATEQTVITLYRKEFYFRFCPDRATGNRFEVTVTTIGVDSKSTMATYVCLPSQLPCSPTSSTHYDPRGIGINSVTLTTGSATLTELHVLVVGWGDGKETNTFLLGATLKKMQ